MKSTYVIILAAFLFNSCKENCGCESEPYRNVKNVEAKMRYEDNLSLPEDSFTICNMEIVPEEILLMSEEAGWDGIDVIISGDLHKWCKIKCNEITQSFITLTEIKLPEK